MTPSISSVGRSQASCGKSVGCFSLLAPGNTAAITSISAPICLQLLVLQTPMLALAWLNRFWKDDAGSESVVCPAACPGH